MKYIIEFLTTSDIRFFLRVIVAGACGFFIGFERKNRAKGAGVRTHFIVAASAALMMIISKYGFNDVWLMEGTRGADPSRVAASIVSGVGFLGAGTIFIQKQTVTGLTTAAGIWATSGIGMAIGAGMYSIGIVTTVFIVCGQIFLHSNYTWLQNARIVELHILEVEEREFRARAAKLLSRRGVTIGHINVNRHAETGRKDYVYTLEVSAKIPSEELIDLFPEYSCKTLEKE